MSSGTAIKCQGDSWVFTDPCLCFLSLSLLSVVHTCDLRRVQTAGKVQRPGAAGPPSLSHWLKVQLQTSLTRL